jgi:putative ABC transport system ATP-binding protein
MSAPVSAEPVIELQDITLTLPSDAGAVNILRGVDLSIGAGETVAVVGPSGSGKTSLLMVVGGLERPTGGRIRIAGTDFKALNEDGLARFRRDHIGIVFQSFHLVPTMTALENVAIPLEFAGRKDAFEQAQDLLESVGLGQRSRHYPGQLSGGEQQRVALARAFAAEPTLLLADEPTGNLDQATGGRIMDLIFGLQQRIGTTLLMVTHDPAIAARCGRMVELTDGKITGDHSARPARRSAHV